MAEKDRSGFVYVIQDENGPCKIGRARNVDRRIRTLSTASSSKLTLVTAWPCEDAAEEEAVQHEFWSEFRVHGEWFRIPEEHVEIWRIMEPFYHPRRDDERAWFELMWGPTPAEWW